MNKNLLIIGAGVYGLVAKEIAESMGTFEKIAFVDDNRTVTPNGIPVLGQTDDVEKLIVDYNNVIVAIGNPRARLSLLERLEKTPCAIATLISPKAYVSPSAKIGKGCIIEPMSVVHARAVLSRGCFISSGAVVNHISTCQECVHIDCNATVAGFQEVPSCTKVQSGQVYMKTT